MLIDLKEFTDDEIYNLYEMVVAERNSRLIKNIVQKLVHNTTYTLKDVTENVISE